MEGKVNKSLCSFELQKSWLGSDILSLFDSVMPVQTATLFLSLILSHLMLPFLGPLSPNQLAMALSSSTVISLQSYSMVKKACSHCWTSLEFTATRER